MRRSALACTVAAILAVTAGCDTSEIDSQRLVSEAVAFSARGENLEAVLRLEQAAALDPDNGRAHYFLGLIRLQALRDPAGAIDSLATATELMPDDPDPSYQLGVAYEVTERVDDAKRALGQAVAIDPEHGRALYRLGVLAEDDGEIREAIDLFTRAIYAEPRFPLAYNALGNLYDRFGRPQEALQVFQNGIENENPNDEETLVGRAQNRADLGRVYLSLDEYDAALTYLRQAVALRADSPAINFNLGIAYRERFEATQNAEDRTNAERYLGLARSRCNPAEERARCESIESALRALEAPDAPEAP